MTGPIPTPTALLRPALAAAIALALAGCATTPPAPVVNAGASEDWAPADYKYRLGPGDELKIHFPLDPDLDLDLTVGPDGRVVTPLIRPVSVAGLTIEAADAALASAYAHVLRVPQLETTVLSYGAAQIYVTGEVKEPGARAIRGEMNVTQAVMMAGGFNETAGTGKVVVLRPRGPYKMLMREIDVQKTINGTAEGELRVLPGDIIFVPRSRIAEVDRIVQQYLVKSLPFTTNYNLNGNRN